jgi:hypothetical protein
VVSVSPADEAIGVRADAEIVFTFNEPMNTTEAERAYESDDIPPSGVAMSWSADDTVLTVHPNELLKYGPTAGSATAPFVYATTITKVARDRAGNRMLGDFSASFQTLRHLGYSLPIVDRKRVKHPTSGPDSVSGVCSDSTGTISIGDGGTDIGYGLLVTFSTASLPALERPEDLEKATLSFSITDLAGGLGALHMYRLHVDPDGATWVVSPVLEDIPLGDGTSIAQDVTSGFVADLAARDDDLVQYFVRYEASTDADQVADNTVIPCSSVHLTMKYLGP